MKIKDFIKELQKCNPEGDLLIETIEAYYPVIGVVDYDGNEDIYIIEQENPTFTL